MPRRKQERSLQEILLEGRETAIRDTAKDRKTADSESEIRLQQPEIRRHCHCL